MWQEGLPALILQLLELDGPKTPVEIEHQLGGTLTAVARALYRLRAKGLVTVDDSSPRRWELV